MAEKSGFIGEPVASVSRKRVRRTDCQRAKGTAGRSRHPRRELIRVSRAAPANVPAVKHPHRSSGKIVEPNRGVKNVALGNSRETARLTHFEVISAFRTNMRRSNHHELKRLPSKLFGLIGARRRRAGAAVILFGLVRGNIQLSLIVRIVVI